MKRIVKGGLTPKMILDDVFCNFSPQIHPSSCDDDDFFVDQLLNLNNDEIQPLETHQLQQQQQQQHMDTSNALLVNSQQQQADEDKETPFLSSPLDTAEEADLEWLSHFVDDSFGPYSTPFPPGYVCPKPESKPEPKPKPVEDEAPALSLRKACRRKRARTGCRVWAGSQPEPTSPSSSPTLKQGTRKRDGSGQQRRCSHCGVQKTPQWRAGPNGSKTLCNACGVRFKSGRLVPEYRPACSPTFSSELHSNSHRKVMEMRMKKEGGPKFGLFHHVSSFG